jgi:hypothetical protein
LTAQAVEFNSLLSRNETLKPLEGGCGRFDMGYAKLILKMNASSEIAAAKQFPDNICKVAEDDEYTDEHCYSYEETALY